MIHTCTRILAWDAAHRVLRHESKCSTLHGHRYTAEITCRADQLDDVGRVIDFGVIKERVGAWIDHHWDHTTICNLQDMGLIGWCREEAEEFGKKEPYVIVGEPTAENLAKELLEVGQELLRETGVKIVKVKLWETPNCFAEYS